jgi:hypothetical protein
MFGFEFAFMRGRVFRHRNWPPFHYAKLIKGPDGELKLYRCYPDGHVEALDIKVSEFSREAGWLILREGQPDLPRSVA